MPKRKTKNEASSSSAKNSTKAVKKVNTHKELLVKIRRLLDRFDNK